MKGSYLQTFETYNSGNKNSSNNKLFLKTPRAKSPLTKNKLSNKPHSSWGSIFIPYIREYCDNSSLHGFRYLTHPDLKYYEKIIWLLILTATTIACCFVYVDLSELYYSQRIHTTVADSVHPQFMVTFPSIGVCMPYSIDWQRLRNDAAKEFLPDNVTNETRHTFYEFFEVMGHLKFSDLSKLAPLFSNNSKINLKLIDHLDLKPIMRYLAHSCNDAFVGECLWRKKAYNCCDLFALERTEAGYCYVFNSIINPRDKARSIESKYYPYHNSKSGEGTGLMARVKIDANKILPNYTDTLGVYIMIKKPDQFSADVKFITHSAHSKIAISTVITETTTRVREVKPEVRRCLFEDESKKDPRVNLPGFKYWTGNCRTRCHQEYVVNLCKCNLDLLFPISEIDNYTACKPSDFKCIYDHAELFATEHHIYERQYIDDVENDSMTCNCFNNCNQILLTGIFNRVELEDTEATNKYVLLDIFSQSDFILKYQKTIRYTFVELVANFGGIMGLFLGASLLSAIELVYYFTIGLYARLNKQIREMFVTKQQKKSSKVQSTPTIQYTRQHMKTSKKFQHLSPYKY
ncbi:pickpocket 21 [Musca autumnalis]|uniref:pickpocket 21 n=1 Tax=Musca autumnalis TaxID=221902 RepID=UPI003CE7D5EC